MTTPESLSRPPDTIDRVSPTRRPDRRPVMYQSWRMLTFLHWEVDPDELRRHVPPQLELDLYQGRAFVGLVPFTMRNVRPVCLPALPWLSFFHETNVRTYVHNAGRDPGVWFFSLEAANPIAVKVARALFHLPYHCARMSLERDDHGVVHYASRRKRPTAALGASHTPPGCDIRSQPSGTRCPADVGSLEHFLLERYLLYCIAGRSVYQGQVHHQPYPAQTAEILACEEDLLAASGLRRPPEVPLVHYSEGVDVEIFGLQRVTVG